MKPYRPELMVFVSPDKKMELHSPYGENSILVKKGTKKDEKIHWKNRMNVELMFSDPTKERLFTVGGLGDSGMSLGVVDFYTFDGELKTINLNESIADLEKLSRSFRNKTNFPWVSAINITANELQLWVCEKKMVRITFSDLKVVIANQATKPTWAIDPQNEKVSVSAAKHQWTLQEEKN